MARIRTIKPEFFTSLTIADLPYTARLTFIGLWTQVDDEGRYEYDPRLVRAALWPLDDRSIEDVMNDVGALTEHSLIVHYEVDGREYLQVNGWAEHQKINRPQPSKLPSPSEGVEISTFPHDTGAGERSLNVHGTFTVGKERKGKEGKGKEYIDHFDASAGNDRGGRSKNDYSEEFEQFWKHYPRKDGKYPAAQEFKKARKLVSLEELIEAVKWYRDNPGTPSGTYAHARTWLYQRRWTDRVEKQHDAPTVAPQGQLAVIQSEIHAAAARDAQQAMPQIEPGGGAPW